MSLKQIQQKKTWYSDKNTISVMRKTAERLLFSSENMKISYVDL